MAKKVVIDLDASKLASILCRANNSFGMKLTFKDKTTGAVINISTDTFLLEVKDNTGTTILTFTNGNGVSIVNNQITFSKSAGQMNIIPGVYNYGLYRTTVSGVVQTRLHGDFEVIAKNAER